MAAGSCEAIQGANSAKITKMRTITTPAAASGLWRAACPIPCSISERREASRMGISAVDMRSHLTSGPTLRNAFEVEVSQIHVSPFDNVNGEHAGSGRKTKPGKILHDIPVMPLPPSDGVGGVECGMNR